MRNLKQSGIRIKKFQILQEKNGVSLQLNYTPGINVKDSTPKDNATKVIAEMISKVQTFEQVKMAASINQELTYLKVM
jgi:hypothetical protein